MDALIFAAGIGSRLQPITNEVPKALAEICGVTLLEIAVRKLKSAGCDKIVINVHHFPDKIISFIHSKNNFGIDIHISDERELLLETGGGLRKAGKYLSKQEPFFIYNVDIVSTIDLIKLYNTNIRSQAIATLAVTNRTNSRRLLFSPDNILYGWENISTGEIKMSRKKVKGLKEMSFSGIQVVRPEIFNFMPDKEVFSIIELYLNIAGIQAINSFDHSDTSWIDVGNPENLAYVNKNPEMFNLQF